MISLKSSLIFGALLFFGANPALWSLMGYMSNVNSSRSLFVAVDRYLEQLYRYFSLAQRGAHFHNLFATHKNVKSKNYHNFLLSALNRKLSEIVFNSFNFAAAIPKTWFTQYLILNIPFQTFAFQVQYKIFSAIIRQRRFWTKNPPNWKPFLRPAVWRCFRKLVLGG